MIDVQDSRELQAAVLAMKRADRDLRRRIGAATRETMNPVWRSTVQSHLAGREVMAARVLGAGVRIAAGNPPSAKAAQSRRAVGSGRRIIPNEHYYLWEFGAKRESLSKPYDVRASVRFGGNVSGHSRKGRPVRGYKRTAARVGAYKVGGRHASRGLPQRVSSGRVVYPAFHEVGPRMVSLWVQLIVKTYIDAAEGR